MIGVEIEIGIGIERQWPADDFTSLHYVIPVQTGIHSVQPHTSKLVAFAR